MRSEPFLLDRPHVRAFALLLLLILAFATLRPGTISSQEQPGTAARSLPWLQARDNRIVNESGAAVHLRGANVAPAGPEWAGVTPEEELRAVQQLTASPPEGWGANLIVLSIFSGPVLRAEQPYLAQLDRLVAQAQANGSYTLLVYRSAEFSPPEQPSMPDQAAQDALAALASRYAAAPAVLYGLQVEPHDVTWEQLKPRFTSMIDAIRTQNPRALIAVPGTQFGRFVHWAVADPIARANLVYAVRYYDPYTLVDAEYQLTAVSAVYPVLLGEFGAGHQMSLDDVRSLLDKAEALGLGWAAWLFHDSACPCLLADRATFSPTPYGADVKARLEGLSPLPIRAGDAWRYLKGLTQPPPDWNARNFDDSSWAVGPSGFGYGDGDDATLFEDMEGGYVSVYVRRAFAVDDPAALAGLRLVLDYDDAFVAYLNGVEVACSNLDGAPPAYNYRAHLSHEASRGDTSPNPPETFDLTSHLSLLTTGKNVLAIEVHNKHLSSSDLSLVPALEAVPGEPG